METEIAVFKGKEIRKTIYENEWHFAGVDVVAALTDSDKPRDYWYRLKRREAESSGLQLSTLCRQLKLESTDGKKYMTEVANTEGGVQKMNCDSIERLFHMICFLIFYPKNSIFSGKEMLP